VNISLLVIVPTRGRRANCERLLKSFEENTDDAELVFVTDSDDQDAYEGMDWGTALHAMLEPREPLTGKLNKVADACIDSYDALMFCGDDHVFCTEHWDTIMLAELEEMGGTGILCPDTKRRNDVPEIWLMSSDIIRGLGWLASPDQQHFYCDNVLGELGKRSGLIRRVPGAVIEHLHYTVCSETERDQVYVNAEETWGASDLAAYHAWYETVMPRQVAALRREFNPDVKWVLSKLG
jgi:hypothetical protein